MRSLSVLKNRFLKSQNRKGISSVSFFILVIGYLFFTVGSSIITPAFSGPDDDFHLTSIWCGQGVEIPNCYAVAPGEYWSISDVPSDLQTLHSCKPRNVGVSGPCELSGSKNERASIRSNSGSYPKLYYWVNNLFVNQDIQQSIVRLRVFNSLLLGVLLILALKILPKRNRWMLMVTTIFTAIPFPLFLLGTNNPQTWSLSLIVSFFYVFHFCLLPKEEKVSKNRSIFAGFYLLLVGSMIIGARGDGKVVILFAIGMSLLLNIKQISRKKVLSVVSAILSTLILGKYLGIPTPDFGKSTMPSKDPGYLLHNILEFPGFILGLFGGKGDSGYLALGEFDVPLPSIAMVAIIFALIVLFSEKSKSEGSRGAIFAGTIGTCFIGLYSMHLQGASTSGYFQPRYLLAFILVLISVVLLERVEHIPNKKFQIALTSLFIGYLGYLYAVILRYSTGVYVEKSKYLEIYSMPNTYVSKETIHWKMFSGDLYGLITINTYLCFWILSISWLIILLSLYYSRNIYKQDAHNGLVSQR